MKNDPSFTIALIRLALVGVGIFALWIFWSRAVLSIVTM